MGDMLGLFCVIFTYDHARFVRPDADNGLHTVRRMGAEPDRGPFLTLLASRINEDCAADLFNCLVVAAAPPALHDLMAQLDAAASASVLGTLARDLITVPDLELWPHLLPWLQHTHVTRTPSVPTAGW